MSELIEIVLIALACPLALPFVIEKEGENGEQLEALPFLRRQWMHIDTKSVFRAGLSGKMHFVYSRDRPDV